MTNHQPVALITGAAKRVGAVIARHLHARGFNVAIHCNRSRAEADALAKELNAARANSAIVLTLDLAQTAGLTALVEAVVKHFGHLDALVNNASAFYRTPIGSCTETQWDELFASNAKAPLFLAQAASPHLKAAAQLRGHSSSIINIADIYAERPLPGHTMYCMAKAALVMMTQSLAKELGPEVRVNAIAPGAILWPEDGKPYADQQELVSRTALKRTGNPEEIAQAVLFMIRDATFTTGEVLKVDGGRALVV